MIYPDISDLTGTESCWDLIEQVYQRAGIQVSNPMRDPQRAEKEWTEVIGDINAWEPGDVLGVESYTPDYLGHAALYLGWGLAIHRNNKEGGREEFVPACDLPGKVIAVYRHVDPDKKT